MNSWLCIKVEIFFVTQISSTLFAKILHTKELSKSQKEEIQSSKRISNPGCYPTGFIALIRPLVDAGIIPPDAPLTVNAISGYTGGGKGLIEIYESDEHEPWGSYGYSMVCSRLCQCIYPPSQNCSLNICTIFAAPPFCLAITES
jgi:hypothetical protein